MTWFPRVCVCVCVHRYLTTRRVYLVYTCVCVCVQYLFPCGYLVCVCVCVSMCLFGERTSDFLWQCSHMSSHRGHHMSALPLHPQAPPVDLHTIHASAHRVLADLSPADELCSLDAFHCQVLFALHPTLYLHPSFYCSISPLPFSPPAPFL